MIEMIPALPDNVIGMIAKGEVTREDYEDVVMPAIDRALESNHKLRLIYVLGADFTGFSGGAMWEDGKLGVEHLTRWERIAVVSDNAWIRHAVNVLGYLIPGEVKVFEVVDEADASAWVTS